MATETILTEDEWPITNNRYVGFIDIMGFKDLVASIPHNDIYDMMKRMNGRKKFVENVAWSKIAPKSVKTTTYSDSIMLYSKDDSYESLIALINTVSGLTHYLFLEGIPHKGSIAFGLMTLDIQNSIFFGKPLIDAYLLQEQLYFYGIIIHATAENQIVNTHGNKVSFTTNYLCPLKNGNAMHLTVQPIYAKTDKYLDEKKNMLDAVSKLKYKTSGYLRKYIDNTEAYLTFVANK